MKLSRIMLAAACIALLSVAGHSQGEPPPYYSANEVMKGCRALIADVGGLPTASDAFLRGICIGQVNALIDGSGRALDICSPSGSTVGQGVWVVVNFIDSRPARLHESFARLALEALRDAWPCKR